MLARSLCDLDEVGRHLALLSEIYGQRYPFKTMPGCDIHLYAALHEALETLHRRERLVLALRYGLEGAAPMTLQEVGNEFGVTRERIRTIETKALHKLRHPSRCGKWEPFLYGRWLPTRVLEIKPLPSPADVMKALPNTRRGRLYLDGDSWMAWAPLQHIEILLALRSQLQAIAAHAA